MKYYEFIEICKHKPIVGKAHIHHIIPVCLGGSDDDTNLIELSLEDHYLAHKLLYYEHPTNSLYKAMNGLEGTIKWQNYIYKQKRLKK